LLLIPEDTENIVPGLEASVSKAQLKGGKLAASGVEGRKS
jgi:hypothetical protein